MKYAFFLLFFITLICKGQTNQEILDQGVAAYEKGDYSQAITHFERVSVLARNQKEYRIEVMAHNNWGNVLCQMGKSEEGMQQYVTALKIAEKHDDKLNIIKIHKNIGTLYSEQKDFDLALSYYQKALDFAKEIDNKSLTADCYNNIGVVLEQQEKYKEALDLYQKALHIYSEEKNKQRIGMTLNNIAIVYKFMKNYPEAIENYHRSIAISEELGDRFLQAANQNNLGNVYAETGDYRRSLELCILANKNAKDIQAQEIIVESYDGIAIVYEKMGQYAKALEYRKLYDRAKSDFINTERSAQLANLKVKYETEQKEHQIQLLHQDKIITDLKIGKQNESIKRRNQLLWLVGTLFLVSIAASWFWVKQLKLKHLLRQKAVIREAEEIERNRIAKDIHDDLGSGLSKINFLSNAIATDTGLNPGVLSHVKTIQHTIQKVTENMHQLIWAISSEEATLGGLIVEMRGYISDYLDDFPIEINYHIPEQLPQAVITKKSHRELWLVVKECINNAVKHADASEINFDIKIEKELYITIKDNGKGFDSTQEYTGNGLKNMKERIASLGGNFYIRTDPKDGTQVTIEVALSHILKR